MFFRFPPDARWNPDRSDTGDVEITGRDMRERDTLGQRSSRPLSGNDMRWT